MKLWERFTQLFTKESEAGAAISHMIEGQAIFTPRDYESFAKEAYVRNVIAHRCVAEIASCVASVEWKVEVGGRKPDSHPLLDLIYDPNPRHSYAEFWEFYTSFLLLAGNSYIEKTLLGENITSAPLELWNLRPDRVQIIAGKFGMPKGYKYRANGKEVIFDVDEVSGKSKIHHTRLFHPTDDWYGLAKVEPAAYAVDQHNSAGKHNTAMFQNSMRPSGIIVIKTAVGKDMVKKAEQDILDRYSGVKNSGKPMILAGGEASFERVGLTAREADYTNTKREVAREVCAGFGVPHHLIVPGEATYRNLEEARLSLWEQTILPFLNKMREGIMADLAEGFGKGIEVDYVRDKIEALAPKRRMMEDSTIRRWESGLITRNEAREQIGMDKANEGDGYKTDPVQIELGLQSPNVRAFDQALIQISSEHERPEIRASVTALVQEVFEQIVKEHGQDVIEEIGRRSQFEIDGIVQNWIRETSFNEVVRIDNTTKTMLKTELAQALAEREGFDAIKERINGVFAGDIAAVRLKRIAITESTKATGFAGEQAIKQSGIEKKEWLTTVDTKTRDTHFSMDGQKVEVDEKFQSPSGATAKHPGGFGVASEDINCRCAVAAVFDGKDARTPDERAALWEEREERRINAEGLLLSKFRNVFKIQHEAVLKRLQEISG